MSVEEQWDFLTDVVKGNKIYEPLVDYHKSIDSGIDYTIYSNEFTGNATIHEVVLYNSLYDIKTHIKVRKF